MRFHFQLVNMSKELNDLKNKLWTAAASVTDEQTAQDTNESNDPSFSSSEAAVQAILESLRNNEFSTAILYIQECRYNHWLMQALSALISMWIKFGNEKKKTFSRFRSPVAIQQSGSFRAYFRLAKLYEKASGGGIEKKIKSLWDCSRTRCIFWAVAVCIDSVKQAQQNHPQHTAFCHYALGAYTGQS